MDRSRRSSTWSISCGRPVSYYLSCGSLARDGRCQRPAPAPPAARRLVPDLIARSWRRALRPDVVDVPAEVGPSAIDATVPGPQDTPLVDEKPHGVAAAHRRSYWAAPRRGSPCTASCGDAGGTSTLWPTYCSASKPASCWPSSDPTARAHQWSGRGGRPGALR